MKKIISKIKDWTQTGLRSVCVPMSPGTRVLVIVILVVVFAAINFYVTFKAVYNIGREDKRWELIDSPIVIPDSLPEDKGQSNELQKEMEDFFNEHFKSEQNDTAKG